MKTTNIFKNLFRVTFITTGMFFISSCSTDDDSNDGDPILEVEPPIVLACNYFSENPNAILEDNPNAPVDYIVTCNGMSIPDDVTIKPGVTIAFESDASFWVKNEGSLNAVGTSDKPITFTGVDKERGAWGGIFFASNDPKNEMNHTVVEYSGGTASSWSTSEKGGVVIGAGASLKFHNNIVQHCQGWGLNLFYSANATNTIIENNTFKENEIPLQISSPFIGLVKGSNQFINNTVNKVEVKCEYPINDSQTIHKLLVPYSITNGTNDFRVGNNGSLVVEPGTIIEMGEGKDIYVWGSLKAVGTLSEKITIKGATESPGSWGRIVYEDTTSPANQIKDVIIKHAGEGANATSTHYYDRGAVVLIYNPRLLIEDTHFEDVLSCIISPSQHGVDNLTVGENITTTNVNTAGVENCSY